MTNAASSEIKLISTAFKDGEAIPVQYTCKGQNINPPLNVVGVPAEAKSLALILHDPDAVGQDYVHWLMWDIPTATFSIDANSAPVGAVQGVNSAGGNSYMGPCPPAGTGTHHYMFEIYALDKTLGLGADTDRDQLKKAMQPHILAQHTLTGTFISE